MAVASVVVVAETAFACHHVVETDLVPKRFADFERAFSAFVVVLASYPDPIERKLRKFVRFRFR